MLNASVDVSLGNWRNNTLDMNSQKDIISKKPLGCLFCNYSSFCGLQYNRILFPESEISFTACKNYHNLLEQTLLSVL
jgi:hypothetical protein